MTAHTVIEGTDYARLVEAIGAEAARKLCEALGGTRIYVPRRLGDNHPIVAAIGRRAADVLVDECYGLMVDLPKAHLRRTRAAALIAEGDLSDAEIALQTDFTERHIRRLRAAEDDGQLDLPFF